MSAEPEFSVNAKSRLGFKKEFTRQFLTREGAESYIRDMDKSESYDVTEYNFTRELSDEQLDRWMENRTQKLAESTDAQKECLAKTKRNFEDSEKEPCEVCGKPHGNYKCCERCNYNNHRCHFCGDDLGHKEVSVCYLMDGWD